MVSGAMGGLRGRQRRRKVLGPPRENLRSPRGRRRTRPNARRPRAGLYPAASSSAARDVAAPAISERWLPVPDATGSRAPEPCVDGPSLQGPLAPARARPSSRHPRPPGDKDPRPRPHSLPPLCPSSPARDSAGFTGIGKAAPLDRGVAPEMPTRPSPATTPVLCPPPLPMGGGGIKKTKTKTRNKKKIDQ